MANFLFGYHIGLMSLIAFNLSNNDFNGHIPSSLAKLTNLEALDLSRNQLSRKNPQELRNLVFLAVINMSHNKLTGQIPQGTQFQRQPESALKGISIFVVFLNKRMAPVKMEHRYTPTLMMFVQAIVHVFASFKQVFFL
ncbi:hypothetical protein AALP_AA1G044700 [Arabis alpina]|uniref:Uncharacterized protein n=1 Tax=Arabis alpina TaxID=50452 RepID=A0A087HL26_ARAAL|nr:hypothetical protein AALP_AA1G044700 [Arabis alpina]